MHHKEKRTSEYGSPFSYAIGTSDWHPMKEVEIVSPKVISFSPKVISNTPRVTKFIPTLGK